MCPRPSTPATIARDAITPTQLMIMARPKHYGVASLLVQRNAPELCRLSGTRLMCYARAPHMGSARPSQSRRRRLRQWHAQHSPDETPKTVSLSIFSVTFAKVSVQWSAPYHHLTAGPSFLKRPRDAAISDKTPLLRMPLRPILERRDACRRADRGRRADSVFAC
jgi:hypothetical protein